VGELVSFIKSTMPPGNTQTLSGKTYVAIAAYLMQVNGTSLDANDLPEDLDTLDSMKIPAATTTEIAPGPGWRLSDDVTLPPWPVSPNRLRPLTPVTDEFLQKPPQGSWLTWRRTQDDTGFSPLEDINKETVRDLRIAWTVALPPGPNESTPLAHDGVIFVHSYGDHVSAFDATSGEEIWHYARQLPAGAHATVHRAIALYEDKLYVATSDVCLVALDARTGKLIWEQNIGDIETTYNNSGGPLVARGIVMQGISTQKSGGSYVVGLDAKTGALKWKFKTVAQPGEPFGDSWNGSAAEKRSGGSVWTPGSYDAQTNLAFFGPAPTYETRPLRKLVDRPGITNDALYTNATVALEPSTGRIIWHYQHLPNDQWNFDWAFERQIIELPMDGHVRRLVLTSGKIAIYDAIDARTGSYVFSIDLGLQNIVTSIHPESGAKTIDPRRIPSSTEKVLVCPHNAGAKSWLPASFNPATHILYVPLVESCMDMHPLADGEPGFPTGTVTLRPRSDSDGKYGRLQAIDLVSRKPLWTARQRAPQTSGALATAGGVVFAGALDRWFSAYDADRGAILWRVRLTDVPNSSPITYTANGRQYVAIVVGTAFGQAATFSSLVPEIRPPAAPSAALWVFELPK
jgi:alcohol dehydrogenase (cytochrome c)